MGEEDAIELKQALIRPLLADLAARHYTDAHSIAAQWNTAFKRELASAIQAPLNAHAEQAPQGTLSEMRHLSTTLNASLRELGLAMRCPKTGGAAWLLAEPKSGDQPDVWRYRFQSVDAPGGRTLRHGASTTLPHLIVTPLPPREEALARKFDRGGKSPPGR